MRLSRFASIVLLAGTLVGACSGGGASPTSPSGLAPSDSIGSAGSGNVDRGPVPPGQPTPPGSGSCTATNAQWARGERASTDLLERARIAARADVARFLRPNQPITTEFNASRLNLGLDRQDVVSSVSCG